MNANLTSVNLSRTKVARFDCSDSGTDRIDRSFLNPNHPNLSHQARRMAVVNLEAALASWKSLENQKVSQMSLTYRSHFSTSLRINPSRTGSMPRSLMTHWFNPDRDNL